MCYITHFLDGKHLIRSISGSQPFAGACPFFQMFYFEQINIVGIEVGDGEVEKEGRINYLNSIIWKGLGQIPGKCVLGSPLLGPEPAVNDLQDYIPLAFLFCSFCEKLPGQSVAEKISNFTPLFKNLVWLPTTSGIRF